MTDDTVQAADRYRLDNDTGCLIIAAVQVAGGLWGIVGYIIQHGNEPPSLMVTLVGAPTILAIYAGSLLWKGKIRGLRLSMWLAAIQIPLVLVPSFGYYLYIGCMFAIGAIGSKIVLLQFGYEAHLSILSDPGTHGFAVNLLAAGVLWYLKRANSRMKEMPSLPAEGSPDASQI